jgi:hypothetical protein
VCVLLFRRARWSSSLTPWPRRQASRSRSARSPRPLAPTTCHHVHGGGADPICINYFPDTDVDYNYTGSGFARTSTLIDHASISSTPSSLLGEETRLRRLDRLHQPARWKTLIYPISGRFALRAVHQTELEQLQQIYSTCSSHPFSMVGYRSSSHFNS